MKLIRLISSEENSTTAFENTFYEDIFIEPKSKIGLVNLSLTISDQNIDVNNTNNTFSFKTANARGERTVALTEGSYSQEGLVSELFKQMNSVLDATDTFFMWKPILSSGKVIIQFNTSQRKACELTLNNMENYGDREYRREGGNQATFSSYAHTKLPITYGVGDHRISLFQNSDKDFIIGLFEIQPQPNSIFALENYDIAVYNSAGKYNYKVNDVTTATDVDIANDDLIVFFSNEGQIECRVYNDDDDDQIFTTAYNFKNIYHFGFSTKNGNGVFFQKPEITPDPFYKSDLHGITKVHELDDEYNFFDYSNLDVPNPTVVSITLPSGLRELLGYTQAKYEIKQTSGKFPASKPLDVIHLPSSVIVETDLVVNSYDGNTHRRRNILAVVPTLYQDDHNLVYQTDHPLMIEMSNTEARLFNSINVRILTIDENLIRVKSKGVSMTILIE